MACRLFSPSHYLNNIDHLNGYNHFQTPAQVSYSLVTLLIINKSQIVGLVSTKFYPNHWSISWKMTASNPKNLRPGLIITHIKELRRLKKYVLMAYCKTEVFPVHYYCFFFLISVQEILQSCTAINFWLGTRQPFNVFIHSVCPNWMEMTWELP